jgi:hypothetical protein
VNKLHVLRDVAPKTGGQIIQADHVEAKVGTVPRDVGANESGCAGD